MDRADWKPFKTKATSKLHLRESRDRECKIPVYSTSKYI